MERIKPRFFAIVGTQRSGTTVLRSIIDTHPKVKAFGEVFIPSDAHIKENYYHYLRKRVIESPRLCIPTIEHTRELFKGYLVYLAELTDAEVILFDCKYEFLRGVGNMGSVKLDNPPYLLNLFNSLGVETIHLTRENVLKMHVSTILTVQTLVWATEHPELMPNRTVHVALNSLKQELQTLQSHQKRWSNDLSGLSLKYEDLFVDDAMSDKVLDQVAQALGLDAEFNPTPRFKKIGLPLHQAIQNYSEVQELLGDTPFKKFLE